MKNKKILIVGGTGFIGFHLARRCLKLNYKVTVLSLNGVRNIRKLKKVDYKIADISNYNKLRLIIKPNKFDYVINLAGYVNHNDKKKLSKGHFKGIKNLLKLFSSKNLKKFVQIGSSAEYGNARSPQLEKIKCKPRDIYGKYKFKASNYLLEKTDKNFKFIILRFYQLYGPHQDLNRFIPQLICKCLKKEEFATSSGVQYRDFLYVEDAIDAIIKSLSIKNNTNKIINIGYGKPIQLKKIMDYASKKTKGFFPKYGVIKLRKSENKSTYPNIKLAKKILKWSPKTPFDIGFNRTLKYYKKNLKKFK